MPEPVPSQGVMVGIHDDGSVIIDVRQGNPPVAFTPNDAISLAATIAATAILAGGTVEYLSAEIARVRATQFPITSGPMQA